MTWQGRPALAGDYNGQSYNQYDAVSPGNALRVRHAVRTSAAATLAPRSFALIDGLPDLGFGNLGIGLIGLTALLLIVKRVL